MVLRCLRTSICLKSVICPFTGLTNFIVPVRDCSIGSKLLESAMIFYFIFQSSYLCFMTSHRTVLCHYIALEAYTCTRITWLK